MSAGAWTPPPDDAAYLDEPPAYVGPERTDVVPGAEVQHTTFGIGVVRRLEEVHGEPCAQVDFGPPLGVKRLMLRHSPLSGRSLTPDADGFEKDVIEALSKLKVSRAAKAALDAELHPVTEFEDLYLDADQLDRLPVSQPLIEGVISRHSYTILSGRDHSFKSFVALDWAFCLATGKPWQGKTVHPVRVLYIIGEGAYGIDKRKKAWEAGWQQRIPADMFTIRRQALDLHAGGPALDELLQRIRSGNYGLVVVDTLRRVSGRAAENSSEMGVVVDNLTKLMHATNGGSVLVIAHTAKDDRDSRGFSGIEDDADIVWHAKRPADGPPMALDLTNQKMKDGPEGERLELTMSPVLDSLVVSKFSRNGRNGLLPLENYDTDDALLAAMRESFAQTGASVTQLIEVTQMSKSTVYKARGRLLESGQLVLSRKGGTDYLFLAGTTVTTGVESPWNPPPDSTPFHTDPSTPVHSEPEHESTPVHTVPRSDSTPVHTPPPVYKTGMAWTETGNACPLHPEEPKPNACDTCQNNSQKAT